MRAVLIAAALASLAGCMCGPQVTSIEASADLAARFDEGNRTAVRDALSNAGFAVDAAFGTIHGRGGDQDVAVFPTGNATEIRVTFDVRDREFRDSEAGSQAARDYIASESARRQPDANATMALVAHALGLRERPDLPVGGSYAIC